MAFLLKTINDAETQYEIHDKELLAIIRALKEWRAELMSIGLNQCVIIWSDYKALEYFMTKR